MRGVPYAHLFCRNDYILIMTPDTLKKLLRALISVVFRAHCQTLECGRIHEAVSGQHSHDFDISPTEPTSNSDYIVLFRIDSCSNTFIWVQ